MAQGKTIFQRVAILAFVVALAACTAPGTVATPAPTAPHPAVSVSMAPTALPAGALVRNPATGRTQFVDPSIAQTAVLFGDSQAGGAAGVHGVDTWVETALRQRGYKVYFVGAGGTGFVAHSPTAANYPDVVERGKPMLPSGNPALVVVQGGGNDATQGAGNAQILANATRLLADLKATYPASKMVMIGTLARGAAAGGGRRTQIDTLLAGFAERHSLAFISAGDWLTRYRLTGMMADGVHLTPAGHKVLTGVLAGKLKDLGFGERVA